MPDNETVIYYVGPGADALEIPRGDGTSIVATRDGDGVSVPAETARSLLARDDFQKNKPTRQQAKVETPQDKE